MIRLAARKAEDAAGPVISGEPLISYSPLGPKVCIGSRPSNCAISACRCGPHWAMKFLADPLCIGMTWPCPSASTEAIMKGWWTEAT